MKVRVVDLMKCYQGEGLKLELPECTAEKRSARGPGAAAAKTAHRGKRTLQIAAALLLVVTAAAVLPFILSRTSESGTMAQDPTPLETFGIPAVDQDSANAESVLEETSDAIEPYVIEGSPDWASFSYGCKRNLVCINDSYYTFTENGPEPVEVQQLHTTIELYGTWEVNMEYAVIDGELAFRQLDNVGDAGTAYPYPIAGSPDTVQLLLKRTDHPTVVEGMRYPVFYNVLTGEISDPLANVPELFSHDSFSSAHFNNALTRAIVVTVRVEDYNYIFTPYVCDLLTGEMTAISELAGPYMSESENPETEYNVEGSGCMWADDDTLLYTVREGNSRFWLYAYDMTSDSIRYCLQDVPLDSSWPDFNQSNIMLGYEDTACMIDTATGTVYSMSWLPERLTDDITSNRHIIFCNDGDVYLVDAQRKGWAKLGDYMALPDFGSENPDEVYASISFLTEDAFCLMTEDTAYFYRIPDDLPMEPLAER